MFASTIYAMLSNGIINLYPSKRGMVFKKDTLAIVKLRNFYMQQYGILSKKIYKMGINETTNVYDAFRAVFGGRKEDPVGYLIDKVLSSDLDKATWNFLFTIKEYKVERSLIDKLLLIPGKRRYREVRRENLAYYEPQARKLREILVYYMNTRAYEFSILMEECSRVFSDVTEQPDMGAEAFIDF